MRRRALAFLCALASLAAPVTARANGRFPAAGQVVVDPGDAKHLVLRATYGLLQSTDAGASWQWICEKAVGYGDNFDPFVAMTGGRVLVALYGGVATSPDRGCAWSSSADPFGGELVTDLSSESAPGHAIALVSTGSASGAFDTYVAESADAGATWAVMGQKLPPDLLAMTLDSAPSRPSRVYVSGIYGTPSRAVVEVTDDRGATWTRRELGESDTPFLAAIDPQDPDVAYVRLDGAKTDRVFVTRDGGQTWTIAFTSQGDLLGFARSPDGAALAIGGPADGVLTATSKDLAFTKVSDQHVRCLAWGADGLYACADEFAKVTPQFTLGRSTDAGKTWQPLYLLSQLSPLECASGTTTGATCAPFWPTVAATLGVGKNDAGASDAGDDAGDDASVEATSNPGTTSGGGCAFAGARVGGLLAWIGVASSALLLATRKRR